MIEFNDDLVAIWYVSFEGGDFLAGLGKKPCGFSLRYRFSGQAGDQKWYEARSEDDLRRALFATRLGINEIAMKAKGRMWEVLKEGKTVEQFAKECAALPFCYVDSFTLDPSERPYIV